MAKRQAAGLAIFIALALVGGCGGGGQADSPATTSSSSSTPSSVLSARVDACARALLGAIQEASTFELAGAIVGAATPTDAAAEIKAASDGFRQQLTEAEDTCDLPECPGAADEVVAWGESFIDAQEDVGRTLAGDTTPSTVESGPFPEGITCNGVTSSFS